MTKPIASIIWPEGAANAERHLVLYMIKVVELLKISFEASSNEPISVARMLLSGEISDESRRAAADHWWAVVDEIGIRNFESRDALLARLAVCLVASIDGRDLGEKLSWFLEILYLLRLDVGEAYNVMEEHFSFR